MLLMWGNNPSVRYITRDHEWQEAVNDGTAMAFDFHVRHAGGVDARGELFGTQALMAVFGVGEEGAGPGVGRVSRPSGPAGSRCSST